MNIRNFANEVCKEISLAIGCDEDRAKEIYVVGDKIRGFHLEKYLEIGVSAYHAAVVYILVDRHGITNEGVSVLTIAERHKIIMNAVNGAEFCGIVRKRDFVGKT